MPARSRPPNRIAPEQSGQARDRTQRRGFARAVRADQADKLALGDFKIDPLHRAEFRVADFQTANFEKLHAGGAVTAPR